MDAEKLMKLNSWKQKAAVLVALAAVTVPLSGCGSQAPQKVAVVDYQSLMANHPDRKAAEEEMMKMYTDLQQKAMEQQNDQSMSQEDRMKKLNDLQQELMTKETNLFTPIKDDVDKKIDDVMKKKGYTSVFTKEALVRGGDDITGDVLRAEGVSEDEISKIQAKEKQGDNASSGQDESSGQDKSSGQQESSSQPDAAK